MEIVLAAVADSANISQENKLNVLGTFDTIPARHVPVHAPPMTLAVTIRAEYEDRGREHRLEIHLVDEDGKRLLTGGTVIRLGDISPGRFVHAHLVTPLHNDLVFERFGRYRILISAGEGVRGDVVLQVSPALALERS
jgi:hypothetical protein